MRGATWRTPTGTARVVRHMDCIGVRIVLRSVSPRAHRVHREPFRAPCCVRTPDWPTKLRSPSRRLLQPKQRQQGRSGRLSVKTQPLSKPGWRPEPTVDFLSPEAFLAEQSAWWAATPRRPQARPLYCRGMAPVASSSSRGILCHERSRLKAATFLLSLLYQDWDADGARSWIDVVARYVKDAPRVQAASLEADLRTWLNDTASDTNPGLPVEFGCDYDPRPDGSDEREWVRKIADFILRQLTN